MRGIFSSLVILCAVAAAGPAFAQATVVGQHRDWGTYSYQTNSGKACYVMSVPKQKEPASLNHGDIFFFVSQKPGQSGSFEPQLKTGYDMQEGSKSIITIGGRSFTMFTQGSSAWLENPADEAQVLAAMRAGADMQVSATSGRGNKTGYTFSLLGLSAALTEMQNCR